jgi:hypothetical protein
MSTKDLRARLKNGRDWRADRSSSMRIGAGGRIGKEKLLMPKCDALSVLTKRKTRARLVMPWIVATCIEYLEKSFSSFFPRKAFHMNNPNQNGPQEAPKTAPQSDTKPAPQQQQSQGDPKQDKPEQQQK